MKRKIKIILAVISIVSLVCLVMTGCSDNTKKYNAVLESNPIALSDEEKAELKLGLTGSLTVYYGEDAQMMKYLAQRYMANHDNVEINFVSGFKDSDAEVTAKLTSGSAGDIVDLSMIDMYRYSGSGTFENLYKYMNEDDSFDTNEYYTNIFKAMEIDNRLLGVPYSFTYTTVRFNKELMSAIGEDADSLEKVSCFDIYDYYTRAFEVSELGEKLCLSDFSMFKNEVNSVFNPVTDVNDFSNFDNYLVAAKDIDEHKTTIGATLDNPYKDDLNITSSQLLRCIYTSASDMNIRQYDYSDDVNGLPVPVCDSDGDITFSVTSGPWAISSKSPNKELAWDFLKYCISNMDISDKISRGMPFHGFSINRGVNVQFYDRINTSDEEGRFDKIDEIIESLHSYYFYNDGSKAINAEVYKYIHGQNDSDTTKANCQEIADKYMGR